MPAPRASTPADDSDLSHSIEDSEPARSICSSSSSDVAAGSSSSSLAEEPVTHQVHVLAAYTTYTPEPEPEPEPEPKPEYKEEAAPQTPPEQEPGPSSEDQMAEDPELEMELKMEEMENNRNSGIGNVTISFCSKMHTIMITFFVIKCSSKHKLPTVLAIT